MSGHFPPFPSPLSRKTGSFFLQFQVSGNDGSLFGEDSFSCGQSGRGECGNSPDPETFRIFPLGPDGNDGDRTGGVKKNFPSLPVSLAPIDLPDLWIPFLKSRQIQKILLFETEIWPSMLLCAMRLGIPAGIVNARLSTRGFRRMSRFRFCFPGFLDL